MQHVDEPKDVASTPGPGRTRSTLTGPVVAAVVTWLAFGAWVFLWWVL